MRPGQGAAPRHTTANRTSRRAIKPPQRRLSSTHLLAVLIATAYSACMPLEDGVISTSLRRPDQLIGSTRLPAAITDNYLLASSDPLGHHAALTHLPYKPAIDKAPPDGMLGLYATVIPRKSAQSGLFNPGAALMALSAARGFDLALGHYWQSSTIPFHHIDDIDRIAVLAPVRITALCGCYDAASAIQMDGTGLLMVDFAARTGRLSDISLAAAGEPSVVGNLQFSLQSANTGFTDNAASLWLQIDGTTESRWDATIAGIVHNLDAPRINALFTGLSPDLERWIIGKFGNKD
jgi:hypothetical protein